MESHTNSHNRAVREPGSFNHLAGAPRTLSDRIHAHLGAGIEKLPFTLGALGAFALLERGLGACGALLVRGLAGKAAGRDNAAQFGGGVAGLRDRDASCSDSRSVFRSHTQV